jgi:hypothetical protein
MDGRMRSRLARSPVAILVAICALHPCSAGRAIAAPDRIQFQRPSGHSIPYYLSLPHGYSPQNAKRWPLIVCVAGADADFQGLARRYVAARGDRPFVLAVPCTFSNANVLRGPMREHYRQIYSLEEIREAAGTGLLPDVNRRLDWDEAGLLAILGDLRTSFGIEPRFYLTGFSGGGSLVYRMIVQHPSLLAAAIPVCPNFNFWNNSYRDLPRLAAPEERAVPVRILLGAQDPLRTYRKGGAFLPAPAPALLCTIGLCSLLAFVEWKKTRKTKRIVGIVVLGALLGGAIEAGRWTGLDAQTDAAIGVLHDRGLRNVERAILPGQGHDPAAEQVFRIVERMRARPSHDSRSRASYQ